MNTCQAILTLSADGRQVYRKQDLKTLFGGGVAAQRTLDTLSRGEVLIRAARGVYVCVINIRNRENLLYDIARALRRGEWVYESYFSAASAHGLVSQCSTALTLVTSGSSHVFKTPYGLIEFTHSDHVVRTIFEPGAVLARRKEGIPLASKDTALRDCLLQGKSLDLIEEEAGK